MQGFLVGHLKQDREFPNIKLFFLQNVTCRHFVIPFIGGIFSPATLSFLVAI